MTSLRWNLTPKCQLNLLDGGHLKRAAVLLFHADPERFITGAFVKIGYFRTDSELLYHDEVHGDLFHQAQQTMELLLTKYLKAGIRYRGIQRVETLPVPEAALREAVLNAIIHKDYASGAPIQIRVYGDRLKVWNAGELPGNWSVANLLGEHSSRPFNPSVANAFFRAGAIEAWGRGVQRILDACREAGAPAPAIRYQPGDLWVEFAFPVEYVALVSAGAGRDEGGVKSRVKSRVKSKENNSDRVLALLGRNSLATTQEMADTLTLSRAGVEKILRQLKRSGRLRRVGPAKGGHWEVLP